jgi:hypothetical protein
MIKSLKLLASGFHLLEKGISLAIEKLAPDPRDFFKKSRKTFFPWQSRGTTLPFD